jgi:uncharacterized protein YndB with AHSA1/START domain
MAHETRALIVEVTIAAPFATVWRALRDPAEIRRWHGWEYDGLDEEIEAIYASGASASEEDGTIDLSDVGTRFAVERQEDGTLVRVTKAAPRDDGFDEIDEGWITFFNQLRFALERHPGEERRTLHINGTVHEPLTPARLGLEGAEVFHRTPHQVGLTVEGWNDALLVVYRGGRVIVSTYGLDEARLADIRERLDAWYPG